MKKILVFLPLVLISCKKEQKIYAPVGSSEHQSTMDISKKRAKQLNEAERQEITNWLADQNKKFYVTSQNYWVDIPEFEKRNKRNPEDKLSYMYDIFFFDGTKVYGKPSGFRDVIYGHFPHDLKAVEHAAGYLKNGEEATLLLPSVLAYGTYGDGNRIKNDTPLIIKIKVL